VLLSGWDDRGEESHAALGLFPAHQRDDIPEIVEGIVERSCLAEVCEGGEDHVAVELYELVGEGDFKN
jgi:hypothetical protein